MRHHFGAAKLIQAVYFQGYPAAVNSTTIKRVVSAVFKRISIINAGGILAKLAKII